MSGEKGSSQSGGGGSAEECEGEDQEEPSSLFSSIQEASETLQKLHVSQGQSHTGESVEEALSNFRQQWQRELGSPAKSATVNQQRTDAALNLQNNLKSSNNLSVDEADDSLIESDEEKAKTLFLKGVEHEQTGKLYEAIQFYKRAVQLIPDIEFRLYESSKMKTKVVKDDSPQHIPEKNDKLTNINEEIVNSDEEVDNGDLLARIERIVSKTRCFCQPEHDQRSAHISCLPMELVLYILRWVVSNELDLLSLERCAAVCRGFYLCARDQEIWRLACIKTWGINCGTLKAFGFSDWRQMFIERPRLRFNGCYISKTTYLRHGENSFQDQFYRPWYLIEYYRYLRFFPDGVVLMLTTADEPSMCCAYLKQRYSRAQGVLSGHYRLHADKVIIVVKQQPPSNQSKQNQPSNTRFRSRRKDNTQESNLGQTFHLELQIQSHRSRLFCSLVWCGYRVFIKNSNGTESSNSFDIVKSKFPPFWFSRVKSFHAEADCPLQ